MYHTERAEWMGLLGFDSYEPFGGAVSGALSGAEIRCIERSGAQIE